MSLRTNATIDWTVRESVREQLRVLVKRILRKYGYPPDLQEQATQYEIEQAEQFSAEWAVGVRNRVTDHDLMADAIRST